MIMPDEDMAKNEMNAAMAMMFLFMLFPYDTFEEHAELWWVSARALTMLILFFEPFTHILWFENAYHK